MFSCCREFWEIFKNIYFEEHLRTAAFELKRNFLRDEHFKACSKESQCQKFIFEGKYSICEIMWTTSDIKKIQVLNNIGSKGRVRNSRPSQKNLLLVNIENWTAFIKTGAYSQLTFTCSKTKKKKAKQCVKSLQR